MAHAVHPTVFHRDFAPRPAAQATPAARPGLLTRFFNAIFESRERAAERAVEAHLARTGFRFTDSIEREINDRLFNGGWNSRR